MIQRRRALQWMAAFAGGGSGLPSQALEALPAPRSDLPIPLGYFGLHVHDPRQNWPALRFGRLRLWDTRTTWYNLQPEPERFDFERLDGIVDRASRAGVEVVMCLGMPPRWAASRPDEPSPYGASALGASSEPRSLVEWERFVRTVGARYKGRLRHYELWNEVNPGTGFYTGTPQALLEVQRVAYETLKAIDPGITFIAPSSVGESEGQLAWFERYLSLMRGRWADVLSYHFYTPRRAPEALLPLAARVRRIADRTGHARLPLWNSESGYRVNWGQTRTPGGTMDSWPNLAPETAAAWAARSAVLGWAAGLDAFFWYAYENGFMGLVGPGMSRSVITDTLGLAVNRLSGARLQKLHRQSGALVATLERDGAAFAMVWSEDDSPRPWAAGPGLPAQAATGWDGTPLAIEAGGMLRIGAMPILVAADAAALRVKG